MKLKKIASLMLAGVMAMSMLAGCKTVDNTGKDDENNTVVVPTSSVVTAVNDGQSATNKVKIDFTADATLDAALSKAVKSIGEYFAPVDLNVEMIRLTGNDWGVWNFLDDNTANTSTDNGKVVEGMFAMPLMNAAADKAAAEKAVGKIVNEMVAELDDTTYVEGNGKDATNAGEKYCDFSYTGSVSMVSSTANDGTVNYYFAVVITQTTTVKTLKAEA